MVTKRKVAVLGGGTGALTAAFELTSTPQLRESVDVTVYSPGWRLGGKGASGRNQAAGSRVEEHGLHLWFGFYRESFRLLTACYEELDRGADAAVSTIDQAFTGIDEMVAWDRLLGTWHSYRIETPFIDPTSGALLPGNDATNAGDHALPDFSSVVVTALTWLTALWDDLRATAPAAEATGIDDANAQVDVVGSPDWMSELSVAADQHTDPVGYNLALMLASAASDDGSRDRIHWAIDVLQRWQAGLEDVFAHLMGAVDVVRVALTSINFAAASLSGIVADRLYPDNFDSVDDIEFLAWLRRHGAWDATAGDNPTPAIRAMYGTSFAFVRGDLHQPDGAAGVALSTGLRMMFGYEGSFAYRMNGGMGDIVFAPLYEVLRRRGVRFSFYSVVESLTLSPQDPGAGSTIPTVDEIAMVRQAALTVGSYEPLLDVRGLPSWPNEPLWDQLVDGASLRADGVNFERDFNPPGGVRYSLSRTAGDFDQVVLALPPDSLRTVCDDFKDREPWASFFATTLTTPTQAYQLWFNETLRAMNYQQASDSLIGTYVQPLDTVVPMDQLLPVENWPADSNTQGIIYGCGVMAENEHLTPLQADQQARSNARQFYEEDLPRLLPAVAQDGSPLFDILATIDETTEGPARFDAQYFRGNVTPTERYTLSTAGSIGSRFPADGSGILNLAVAGDWVDNPINTGCIEAATLTGIAAARMLNPMDFAGGPSSNPYIDYGTSMATVAAGPSVGDITQLFAFFLDACPDKLHAYCRDVLSKPTHGTYRFVPLSNKVMVSFGSAPHLASTTPPWSGFGSMPETQVTLWMFVARLSVDPRSNKVVRVLAWVPYIYVDNPYSLTTGREFYGFSKNLGRIGPLPALGERPSHLTLDVFGGNFAPNSVSDWHRLLSLTGTGQPASVPTLVDATIKDLFAWLDDVYHDGFLLPSLSLAEEITQALMRGATHELFIRQLRNAQDPTTAEYFALMENSMFVSHLAASVIDETYDFSLTHLDSDPIFEELGVDDQTALFGLVISLDLDIQNGVTLWRS